MRESITKRKVDVACGGGVVPIYPRSAEGGGLTGVLEEGRKCFELTLRYAAI